MQHSSTPWWMTDSYDDDRTHPAAFESAAGPKGMALVRAWPDGRTDQGWGLHSDSGEGFMPRYMRGEFNSRRVLFGFTKGKWAFAFVMRSMQLVCLDIDGKNGGFAGAKALGMLPQTLAETSKSGNGFHLFYSTDEMWDPLAGYGLLSDRIGIEDGVDFRGAGCVYHHPPQRWNNRPVAPLPVHLRDILTRKQQRQDASSARIKSVLASNDDLEVLMLHDEILSDLAKDIPAGRRNNTLFAIGGQMHEAGIPDWETKLKDRASQLGLEDAEADKIVANVTRYAGRTP